MVDVGDGVLVVVDFNVLFQLPVLVPLFNLDNVLDVFPVSSASRREGRVTQTHP